MKKSLKEYSFPDNYSIDSKKDVYDFLLNIYKDLSQQLFIEKNFKYYFPSIYEDFSSHSFPNTFKFTQKLWHYLNDDIKCKLGYCHYEDCNKRTKFDSFKKGYLKYCSQKCYKKSDEWKNKINEINNGRTYEFYQKINEKRMETNMKKYGCKNPNQFSNNDIYKTWKNNIINKYGSIEMFYEEDYKRTITAINEKFGVNNVWYIPEMQEKMSDIKEQKYGDKHFNNHTKYIDTCLNKYNHPTYLQSDVYKKTMMEKYNFEHISQTEIWKNKINNIWKNKSDEEIKNHIKKIYDSMKKHNSFNKSKIEKSIEKYFYDNDIKFEYQYMDKRYSFNNKCFNCDFYLPDYDLFIEIQGTWSHGNHPFNPTNKNDLYLLEYWKSKNTKYYNSAINIWTKKDVLKRHIAKENNLNYLEIFSIDLNTCVEQILTKIKELG